MPNGSPPAHSGGGAIARVERAPAGPLDKELVADALLHGAAPPGPWPWCFCRFAAAALAALGAVLWTALRFGGGPAQSGGDLGPTWLAVHGEWTNRTRHVLGIAAADPRDLPILILGRPRQSLSRTAALVAAHCKGRTLRLIRPVSLPAAARSFPAMGGALAEAWRRLRAGRHWPPARRLTGILYRLCLGELHRAWWRRAGAHPRLVIYGHTGTADVAMLEVEQQNSGTRTVHLFHGISTGHLFTAFSDLLIARSGHDADWHRELGGYGACLFVEAERPRLSMAEGSWALATNHAHPSAFANEKAGVRFEVAVIDCVAAAARRVGQPAARIHYRPHPSLAALTPGAQEEVREAARAAGFAEFGGDLALADCELVLATPSTMVQDSLLAGTLPLVIDLAGADPGSVYGAYPFTARSEAELAAMIGQVRERRSDSFERAWRAVRPGRTPDVHDIERIADALFG